MNKFILFAFLACVAVVACHPVEENVAPLNIVAEAAPAESEVKPVKHHHEEKKNGDQKKAHEHHHHEGGHFGDFVTPEEKKRLLEVFKSLSKDQQDACDKKSWKDGHKNHTEEERAAWKKLGETEKKEKKVTEWNAKSDEEKACTIHKMEEFGKKKGDDHPKGGHSRDITTPEEKKRLLELFANLTKENQDACDKKSWKDENKNKSDKDWAAWRKMNETERREKQMAEWNAKSDEEKACSLHKIEEMKKKMMGGRRGEENPKWGGAYKKQRGEQEMKKSGEESSKSRGNNNGSIGQNSRRAGADKSTNGSRRGQQKPQVQA